MFPWVDWEREKLEESSAKRAQKCRLRQSQAQSSAVAVKTSGAVDAGRGQGSGADHWVLSPKNLGKSE